MRFLSTPGTGAAALAAGLLAGAGIIGAPAGAQVSFSAVRAFNLARNVAVQQNGGLGVYRPAQCMFQSADVSNECLVSSDDEGFLFRFLGGVPGWEQYQMPATVLTELRISADGRQLVELIYNGPPRTAEPADQPAE
jgi:hypothetical protein